MRRPLPIPWLPPWSRKSMAWKTCSTCPRPPPAMDGSASPSPSNSAPISTKPRSWCRTASMPPCPGCRRRCAAWGSPPSNARPTSPWPCSSFPRTTRGTPSTSPTTSRSRWSTASPGSPGWQKPACWGALISRCGSGWIPRRSPPAASPQAMSSAPSRSRTSRSRPANSACPRCRPARNSNTP